MAANNDRQTNDSEIRARDEPCQLLANGSWIVKQRSETSFLSTLVPMQEASQDQSAGFLPPDRATTSRITLAQLKVDQACLSIAVDWLREPQRDNQGYRIPRSNA